MKHLLTMATGVLLALTALPLAAPAQFNPQQIAEMELAQLRDNLSRLKAEVEVLRREHGDAHPDVKSKARELEQLRARIDMSQPLIKIYRLKNVKSSVAANLAQELIADRAHVRIAVDERLNGLIISAPRSTHEDLGNVLEAVDQPTPNETQNRSFMFADEGTAKSFVQQVESLNYVTAWSMNSTGRDVTVNLVVRQTDAAGELYNIAQRLNKKTTPKSRRIRVVWLVSELEKPRPLPDDMKPVVAELEKYVGTAMVVAAQTSVRSLDHFDLTGLAELDLGERVSLSVQGRFVNNDDLQISLRAKSGNVNLASISTVIQSPLGHPVVLGVSPINAKTSAFVVTVYEGD